MKSEVNYLVAARISAAVTLLRLSALQTLIASLVAVAALNLVLDFSFIERASASGAPKYMEWYGAFGLMVTLVWLYLEILRLLSKVASRD